MLFYGFPNGKVRIVLVNESVYVVVLSMRVSNPEHNGAEIFMRLHSILWISQNEILSEILIAKISIWILLWVNLLGDNFCFT